MSTVDTILVTTMGRTWPIIPELLAYTNPDLVDLYANHLKIDDIRNSRTSAGISPADEVWIVTTDDSNVTKAIGLARNWITNLNGPKPKIEAWQAAGTAALAGPQERRILAELILRAVLHASHKCQTLLLSLAGGYKTMSADMQLAASVFGCRAMLHVFADVDPNHLLFRPSVDDLRKPLSAKDAEVVYPIALAGYPRNSIVDVSTDSAGPIAPDRFPLPSPSAAVALPEDAPLLREVEDRITRAQDLMFNHFHRLSREKSANFLGLYQLAPKVLGKLQERRLGVDPSKAKGEIQLLRTLPKAELHCHLGGVANPAETIEIAKAAMAEAKSAYDGKLKDWLDGCRRLINESRIDELRRKLCAESTDARRPFKCLNNAVKDVPEPYCAAAFVCLFDGKADLLERLIYGECKDPVGVGFDVYEAWGDLQGSTLLKSRAAITKACQVIAEKAVSDNVRYLELRCSPAKYAVESVSAQDVVSAIREAFRLYKEKLEIGLILIASRRGDEQMVRQHIDLALSDDHDAWPPVVGFDLAGAETAKPTGQLRDLFLPLMERCMHVTIHAGEIAEADSIWQAVYCLSAERVGHGLTLIENEDLMQKFADRRIALEMCPSSNLQIVGFRDCFLDESQQYKKYPLKEYLDYGLRVTVNTDNPGMSRTTLSQEIHRAARLTPGGLNLWEILQIIRNGFRASFAKRETRHRLIQEAEKKIVEVIQGYV